MDKNQANATAAKAAAAARKDATIRENINFVYGRTEPGAGGVLDPDKGKYARSRPKFVDTDAISDFRGDAHGFLLPSFPCDVYLSTGGVGAAQLPEGPYPSFDHALQACKCLSAEVLTSPPYLRRPVPSCRPSHASGTRGHPRDTRHPRREEAGGTVHQQQRHRGTASRLCYPAALPLHYSVLSTATSPPQSLLSPPRRPLTQAERWKDACMDVAEALLRDKFVRSKVHTLTSAARSLVPGLLTPLLASPAVPHFTLLAPPAPHLPPSWYRNSPHV